MNGHEQGHRDRREAGAAKSTADVPGAKVLPTYAPAKAIQRHVVAVPAQQLRRWADQGYIRTIKLGDSRQSGRIFNVEDLQELCERLAHGYAPRRKTRHCSQV